MLLGFRAGVSWVNTLRLSSSDHERFPVRIVDCTAGIGDRTITARLAPDVCSRANPGRRPGAKRGGAGTHETNQEPGATCWAFVLTAAATRSAEFTGPRPRDMGNWWSARFRPRSPPRIQIVLDTHPASHLGSGPDSSREWAIRVAASFAEGWINQGAEVEMILDRGCVSGEGRFGTGTVGERARRSVAQLEPGGSHRFSELWEQLGVPAV